MLVDRFKIMVEKFVDHMQGIFVVMRVNALLASIAAFTCIFLNNDPASAAVTLPWSTTYNCAEWEQGLTLSCDGLQKYGDWTTLSGKKEQITAGANNPGGNPSSKGQRHWFNNGDKGQGAGRNNNSGGLYVQFATPQVEFWMRFYMRPQLGFYWSPLNYYKLIYFEDPNGNTQNYLQYNGANSMSYYPQVGDAINRVCSNCGFITTYQLPADGNWDAYEIYVKLESAPGISDGIVLIWVNGILKINFSNVRHGPTWGGVLIASNSAYFIDSQDMYIDYDDIAIVNQTPAGRDAQGNPMIGPIGWGSSLLSNPQNFTIIN